jgi:hypothetical protein
MSKKQEVRSVEEAKERLRSIVKPEKLAVRPDAPKIERKKA